MMNDWKKTHFFYLKWLSNNNLKKHISNNLVFEGLSIWWLTNLSEKDNVNNNQWYQDLNRKLNKKKIHIRSSNFCYLYIKLIMKLLFACLSKLFFYFLCEKNDFRKVDSCMYSLYTNQTNYNGARIDRQYGLFSTTEINKKKYIINIPDGIYLLKNFFSINKNLKKIKINYLVSNKHIKFCEIIKIYFLSFVYLIRLKKILKKKNFFIINGIDCRDILEPKLILSFFGQIQDQLIKGIALENCLKKIKCKNFINCFDFHPTSRCLYHFSKKKNNLNIVNVNHAIYSQNNLFFSLNSKDFNQKYSLLQSPKPDFYFCQGKRYYNYLKKFFNKKNIFCIGSLKLELNKNLPNYKEKKINKFKKQNILVLCNLNDYKSFIKILNKLDSKKFNFYVASHPLNTTLTIKHYKLNFNKNFIDVSNINKKKILKKIDYIIFGDTSLGFELAIKNYKVIRLYDNNFIPSFDIDNELPTATSASELLSIMNKNYSINKRKIEENYFFKYDNKASERLQNILKKIS